jgi:hypothetical protein
MGNKSEKQKRLHIKLQHVLFSHYNKFIIGKQIPKIIGPNIKINGIDNNCKNLNRKSPHFPISVKCAPAQPNILIGL